MHSPPPPPTPHHPTNHHPPGRPHPQLQHLTHESTTQRAPPELTTSHARALVPGQTRHATVAHNPSPPPHEKPGNLVITRRCAPERRRAPQRSPQPRLAGQAAATVSPVPPRAKCRPHIHPPPRPPFRRTRSAHQRTRLATPTQRPYEETPRQKEPTHPDDSAQQAAAPRTSRTGADGPRPTVPIPRGAAHAVGPTRSVPQGGAHEARLIRPGSSGRAHKVRPTSPDPRGPTQEVKARALSRSTHSTGREQGQAVTARRRGAPAAATMIASAVASGSWA